MSISRCFMNSVYCFSSGIAPPLLYWPISRRHTGLETLFTPEGGKREEYLQVRGCRVLH